MAEKKRGFGAFAATEAEQTALRNECAEAARADASTEAPRLAPKPVSATEPTAPKLVK